MIEQLALPLAIPDDLPARARRLNSAWSLRVVNGEWELTGNGAPAAWRAERDCDDWIEHMERGKRR